MPAYIVFMRENIRDEEEMKIYSRMAGPTFAGHEAIPRAVYRATETLEGPPTDSAVIVEFKTVEAARAWYDSPAYQEAKRHRHLGADYRAFIIQGV
ncbi:DUF1330 domain-containing protein [Sphingobium aromaticivastans]|uniref:DUF1330 domain-containing protein n=1 Tax=Sphingobium aromaticivastans TaxID=1778665 RepID=UPI003015E770